MKFIKLQRQKKLIGYLKWEKISRSYYKISGPKIKCNSKISSNIDKFLGHFQSRKTNDMTIETYLTSFQMRFIEIA